MRTVLVPTGMYAFESKSCLIDWLMSATTITQEEAGEEEKEKMSRRPASQTDDSKMTAVGEGKWHRKKNHIHKHTYIYMYMKLPNIEQDRQTHKQATRQPINRTNKRRASNKLPEATKQSTNGQNKPEQAKFLH